MVQSSYSKQSTHTYTDNSHRNFYKITDKCEVNLDQNLYEVTLNMILALFKAMFLQGVWCHIH